MRFRLKPRRLKKTRNKKRSFPEPCDTDMSFQECELAILRQAVDENENQAKKKIANSDDVKNMISIVEDFLREKKCICYGGTAINNILPEESQFYNRDLEVPDYDFYSDRALEHAKELADIFYSQGYSDVEAKAGVHYGTFKVFVNFIPMADITTLHPDLHKSIQTDAVVINGIYYTPPNFLRMSMYLELSRPNGDVSRWEKVLKRISLLNKHYPLKATQCDQVDFQRNMDNNDRSTEIYYALRDSFIQQKVVFFGGYASSLYARYMPYNEKRMVRTIPDFDVLSDNPDLCTSLIQQKLKDEGFGKIKIMKHAAVGEVVPEHYELLLGKDTLAFIYKPIACHNYNEISLGGNKIRVATIETILSFYLAFLYTDHEYYSDYKQRLLCMCQFLFDVNQKNRLSQLGLLKRFSLTCYGTQPTLETMRTEKTEMFRLLKNKRNDPEYEKWFLKYVPSDRSLEKKGQVMAVEPPKKTKRRKRKKAKTLKEKRKSEYLY